MVELTILTGPVPVDMGLAFRRTLHFRNADVASQLIDNAVVTQSGPVIATRIPGKWCEKVTVAFANHIA
ncbi:MAG TPA: hypothetical protein EYG57_09040 [Planctomycetes bacterium]|nr:hypothetical protein [Planctomycetota bacterium]